MKIINKPVSLVALQKMAKRKFGNMVKAVVDVDRGIMAVDGELHADEEALLIERGSKQEHLWGINLYPELDTKQWIEFDSMINLRPSVGNMTRGVSDPKTRRRIIDVVNALVRR